MPLLCQSLITNHYLIFVCQETTASCIRDSLLPLVKSLISHQLFGNLYLCVSFLGNIDPFYLETNVPILAHAINCNLRAEFLEYHMPLSGDFR